MPPSPELAKLSRPRLYRVSARERVFRALDELREYPLVWVTGAPGAGESAAVASWLEVRKLASIWYHVDPGDADPATFFHYLGGALPARGPRGPLPLFADEYRRDLPGFTRRWFREFFARMTPASVLAFVRRCGFAATTRGVESGLVRVERSVERSLPLAQAGGSWTGIARRRLRRLLAALLPSLGEAAPAFEPF